jgi:predicted Ser/Thr protein kinase/tetratricopeptide (TPR) repeat protein
MDPARYARAKALFEAARDLAAPEQAAFLAQECKDDPALGREVAELLHHHEAAREFLTEHPGAEAAPAERPMPKLKVPGFTLERELGRGGMGIVVLAEQERPRRAVALKFLRLDSLRPADVKRFEREAEILGQLNHPGIAHVYGVGLAQSEQGELPWIAMEYVRGSPVHEHVAGHDLDLRALVELFADLCDAVEHAHQKGIVHRDLKPSNVLVDERGQVRVLDFGVARLLGDDAGDVALRTRTGQLVGTLAYASPEQASGRTGEIGAHSDVYSLGVMLQELLTGELPYAIDESKIVEAIQTICDEDPRRLRRSRRDAPADLETVLLKALDKEPARRYANAGELAADLRRYLAERPVTARPPTALYQVRKFVRRNRALTVSTTAVILALLVTVGVLADSRRRDRLQVARERSRRDLMAQVVFQVVPEAGFAQDHPGLLEGLDRSLAQDLERDPADRALRGYRARSLYELGTLDQTAGDLTSAQRRFEEAQRLRDGLIAENPSDLESRTHLSQIYAHFGELARARGDSAGQLSWFQRAFDLDQQLVRENPGDGELVEDLGWSLERMADLAMRRGASAERERLSRRRLEDAIRLVDQDPDNWKFLYNAAQAHQVAAGLADHTGSPEGEGHRRELTKLARRLCELQPRRAVFQQLWASANIDLGRDLWVRGRRPEALPYAEAGLGLALQLFAGDPSSWLRAETLRLAAETLRNIQLDQGLDEQADGTLARMRVAASLAGEDSLNSHFLLACAEGWTLECHPAPEARREARERVLREYQSVFLSADASAEVIETVAGRLLTVEYGPELCRRLLAANEPIGRRVAELLGVEPDPSPRVVAGEEVEPR